MTLYEIPKDVQCLIDCETAITLNNQYLAKTANNGQVKYQDFQTSIRPLKGNELIIKCAEEIRKTLFDYLEKCYDKETMFDLRSTINNYIDSLKKENG